ncbi:MAG TPA: pitrilysin family protein [Candidatus Gastranaerophilales bacterium]|nr:pitrilysin family protein [Candidatus Gastranaerophilales bacterium]
MNIKIPEIKSRELINFPYVDKAVEFYYLENGHTIIIANKPGKLVNISTWIKTGSINEDDSITGVSHFLEHLMFKGTPKYPAGEFDRILESKGAVVNAATWKDYTFYYVTIPNDENNENLNLTIELHADMILNPLLPEEEIGPVFDPENPNVEEKRERFVVIEEIRMRDDNHWTKTYDEMNSLMYKVHQYKRDVIGTADVIASIPRETIVDYYKKWYTPENMYTIITGDVDAKEILEIVRKNFIFPEERKTVKLETEKEPLQTESRYVENFKKEINTGFLMMGFHGPQPKDLKDNICLDILSIVLGEGKSSRFYQNLIEKQPEQIFNVTGTSQYEFREGNVFLAQGNFVPAKKEKALELIKNEFQKVIDQKIEDYELKKAKKKLKTGFAEDSETVSDIGELIGHFMTVYECMSCYVTYLDALENITADDVLNAAKKYLDLNKVSISVLMPE